MPLAARFVQTGSVISLHNINNDNVIEFYPATSELLHAVGIVLMGSDFLSALVNVVWLALALFAAWCVGRRYGVASISVVAASMVLGTVAVIGSEPGTAYNDIVGVALVLATLGLLAYVDALWDPRRTFQGLWVAALAAGLAIGVKDTLIVPVAALTVGVIALLPRGQRVRRGLLWCLVIAVTGGFWYVRNLIYAGNPVPNIHLALGPLRLPSPPAKLGRRFRTTSSMVRHGGPTSFRDSDRRSDPHGGQSWCWRQRGSSLESSESCDGSCERWQRPRPPGESRRRAGMHSVPGTRWPACWHS